MTRKPTIIDVAKKANVSKSTVSLVLRNSSTVREETRDAVRQAMKELGYVYNRSAANMRSSNAGLIGLVINDLRNPFFAEFATSLQMALAQQNYATVMANTDEDPALQDQVVNSMIEHGVSALIICPAYGETRSTFDAVERAGLPALQLLRRVDERTDHFPFIAPDYSSGSRLAAEHLLQQGAQRVAFVGGLEGRSVTEERMSGCIEVLRQAGQEPVVITGQASRQFGRETARTLMQDYPDVDAVVCFNDLVALGLLSGSNEVGRCIGKDILLVGFDNIEDAAETYPSLSSVSCDIAAIGQHASASILNWLEKGVAPARVERTKVELIRRQSSDTALR
ncbi:LacI family DNA-binding transcriptional regulator [Cognatishimia sp.]|uniref:LacI family DNA-binding transcriptional regulator n=1 Tax=Cognatishimia sp. TaxID=2211648 RepID=UPI003519B3B3